MKKKQGNCKSQILKMNVCKTSQNNSPQPTFRIHLDRFQTWNDAFYDDTHKSTFLSVACNDDVAISSVTLDFLRGLMMRVKLFGEWMIRTPGPISQWISDHTHCWVFFFAGAAWRASRRFSDNRKKKLSHNRNNNYLT